MKRLGLRIEKKKSWEKEKCVCSSLWVCVCICICVCVCAVCVLQSAARCWCSLLGFDYWFWESSKLLHLSIQNIRIGCIVTFISHLSNTRHIWLFGISISNCHLNGDAVLAANWADNRAPSGSLVGLVVEWANVHPVAGNRSHHRQHSWGWSPLPQVKYTTRSPWQWSHPWNPVSWPSSRCQFPQPWCH